MSNKRLLSLTTAVLALALTGPASAVEFVFGAWPPAGEWLNRVALPKAFGEIAKQTNNKITWKLVPGGQLADPKATFQAVQDGLMQGGLGISTYVPNLVPSLNTIYSTIVFTDDTVAASGAALETVTLNCPSCQEEFKKINAIPLSGWTSSPYQLACTSPVKTLADLKGKRVRATGGNAEFVKFAGAVPVAATLVEAVGLLQRGGLDCQFGVHGWLRTFGYADVAKYVTSTPLGLTGPAMNVWNRDMWKQMTPDQRKIHLKQMSFVSASLALGQFVIENEEILADIKKNKGVQVVQGDDKAFLEVAKKYDSEQRATNIANAKKFGVANPEAIIDAYVKNQQKWSKISKEVGRDIDKYAAAIQREIYDKVDVNKM
ncbi:MAG TPA: TRAP transporter substrate-binding protein DctP [Xanthobacteraceae bacterium]|nr:TRAP transporter substrate-binding protein DctP [Xanthobacteraceae bacterium]